VVSGPGQYLKTDDLSVAARRATVQPGSQQRPRWQDSTVLKADSPPPVEWLLPMTERLAGGEPGNLGMDVSASRLQAAFRRRQQLGQQGTQRSLVQLADGCHAGAAPADYVAYGVLNCSGWEKVTGPPACRCPLCATFY
jgi:hypothetical protein